MVEENATSTFQSNNNVKITAVKQEMSSSSVITQAAPAATFDLQLLLSNGTTSAFLSSLQSTENSMPDAILTTIENAWNSTQIQETTTAMALSTTLAQTMTTSTTTTTTSTTTVKICLRIRDYSTC
jgi:hypothetical protein